MTKLNPNIFRAYDIRGVYPKDLNEQAASRIGLALAWIVKNKFSSAPKPTIAIGRDMRLSSKPLFESLVKSLVESGVNVSDLGLTPVDAVYFAVGKFAYEAGVMITASHNPPAYGGFKMVLKGMEWLRGTDLQEQILLDRQVAAAPKPGQLNRRDIWPDYVAHVHSFISQDRIKPLKVVVDAGNGLAGEAVTKLLAGLPVELIPLFFELDGSFPNRPSNPLEPGAIESLARIVIKESADFGVIFDGDTDRLMFVDERGKFIKADTALIILARHLLAGTPGRGIAHNVICSKAVPELVSKFGGRPIRTPVGYVNVSQGLKDADGILGGEVSAHYSFRDNFYADSGMIPFLIMLQIVSESGQRLSEIARDFAPYCRGDEVNLEIQGADKVIAALKNHHANAAQIDELDGLTVEYPSWWFNVRPSNTEPLLRITVEADTCAEMEQRRSELIKSIKASQG